MQTNEEVVYLYLDDIIPNRFQPREVFDEKPLKELAVSIKEHGVIQPIIVRKVNDKYEIIAGERRYKASALAGLTKIPAIIRDLDDKESSKVALLENLQRKNLNAIEEAKTYQKILEIDQMTQEELAKTMGKSQSAVANKIRLLSLPEEVQDALMNDKISERHARALLNIEDKEKQKEMLEKIMNEKLTVRQVESEINESKKNNIQDSTNISETQSETKTSDIQNNFIPENPILPNFDGENNDLNTPILSNIDQSTIKSSESISNENDTSSQNKFINFGNISSDDNDDEENPNNDNVSEQTTPINFFNNNQDSINLEELKKKTTDINSSNNTEGGADLDNLLQINNPSIDSSDNDNNSFKFFSPAADALKESENKNTSNGEDYFKAPELVSVDLPNSVPTTNINSVSLNSNNNSNTIVTTANNSNDLLNSAVENIRNTISKIKGTGLNVESDEASLDNSYQIIIKISKN